jgi:hypothetical protein
VHAMVEISRQDAAGGVAARTKLLAEAGAAARQLLAMAELAYEEQVIGESRQVRYVA